MIRFLSLSVLAPLVSIACVALAGSAWAGEPAPLPWVEGSATLAVLPDTERYSDDYPHLFEAQTKWIAENCRTRNVVFAIHLGDITQRGEPAHWEVARRSFALLDGKVPCALALGNHDYGGADRSTRFTEFFPLDAARKWSTFGGVFQEGRLDNCYHLFRIGKRDWIVLVLEFGPRDETIAWANDVLGRHRDRLALLVTHAYLFRGNVRYDHLKGSQRASPHGWGADGEELWQKLVRRHPNTMIVLSGHVSTGGVGHLVSEADYGNKVHQIMCDYEKGRQGGSAYMRLMEFLPDGKTVQVRTYSPALDRYATDPANQFSFELAFANRDTPKPVAETPTARLAKAPIHRYGFQGVGGANARVLDSARGAQGVLRAGKSSSRLNGKGQLILTGDGHVALPSRLVSRLKDVSFEVWFTPTADAYKWNSPVRFGSRDDWLVYTFRTLTVHRAEIAVDRHNEDIQRSVPAERGKPMHVIVTYDHDGADGRPLLAYYRDGRPFGTMGTDLRLGDVEDTGNTIGPFVGEFDELRVYDYALSAEEAMGSYLAGPDVLEVDGDKPDPK